jgi:hypothetical protein
MIEDDREEKGRGKHLGSILSRSDEAGGRRISMNPSHIVATGGITGMLGVALVYLTHWPLQPLTEAQGDTFAGLIVAAVGLLLLALRRQRPNDTGAGDGSAPVPPAPAPNH